MVSRLPMLNPHSRFLLSSRLCLFTHTMRKIVALTISQWHKLFSSPFHNEQKCFNSSLTSKGRKSLIQSRVGAVAHFTVLWVVLRKNRKWPFAGQTAKICFWRSYYQKSTQREFPSQNTPFSNFLTTQPIHPNSNSIYAAQQVEHDKSWNTLKISV
jgi:hypothetical protein